MSYQPLSGIRVLEWARDFPGPHTTRKLADLGADVVKLSEIRRNGDSQSKYAVEWRPLLDRNKRSVTFDLTDDADVATVRRLAESADVFVEGARPGAFTARTGIEFGQLRAANAALVICSVSGFGQTGPLASQPAHGLNLESLAHCLFPIRDGDEWLPGEASNVVVTVELAPINAAFAIMAALWHAKNTGEGAWIDVSAWDAGVEAHRHRLTDVLNGREPWYDVPNSGARYALYDCADGRPVFFGGTDPKFWRSFCTHVGRDDLIETDLTPAGDAALRAELKPVFKRATASEWNDRFGDWNVAGSEVVMSLAELANHPHFAARKMTTTLPDGETILTDTIRWVDSDSRPGEDPKITSIGADTDDVIAEWLRD